MAPERVHLEEGYRRAAVLHCRSWCKERTESKRLRTAFFLLFVCFDFKCRDDCLLLFVCFEVIIAPRKESVVVEGTGKVLVTALGSSCVSKYCASSY